MINYSRGIAKGTSERESAVNVILRIWIKWSWLYRLNRNKMFNCTVLSRRYFLPAFASPFPSLLLSLSLPPFSLLSPSLPPSLAQCRRAVSSSLRCIIFHERYSLACLLARWRTVCSRRLGKDYGWRFSQLFR